MIGTPLTQDTLPEVRGGHVEVPTRRPARAAGSPDASYTYRLTQAVQRYSRQLRAQPYRHGSGNQHRRAASLDAMVFTLTRSPSPIQGVSPSIHAHRARYLPHGRACDTR